jgi:hypothetical protein
MDCGARASSVLFHDWIGSHDQCHIEVEAMYRRSVISDVTSEWRLPVDSLVGYLCDVEITYLRQHRLVFPILQAIYSLCLVLILTLLRMAPIQIRELSTGDTINLTTLLVSFFLSMLSILIAILTWRLHRSSILPGITSYSLMHWIVC